MNRTSIANLCAFACIGILAVLMVRGDLMTASLRSEVEAHDQRLLDHRYGRSGLDELHHRITETQLEQIRLQRELEKLKKPLGEKVGSP